MPWTRPLRTAPPLALTFDDGPAEVTGQILDLFAAHAAAGTFFVIGERVPGGAHLVRRAVAEGSEIGNHSYSHPRLSSLGSGEIDSELRRASAEIERATAVRPVVMRPPYGDGGAVVAPVARRLGMRTVMWSGWTGDWSGESPTVVAARMRDAARPGGVIVLHDGDYDSGEVRQNTLDALELVVPELARRFRLVTVSTLLAESRAARRQTVVSVRGPVRRRLSALRGAFETRTGGPR